MGIPLDDDWNWNIKSNITEGGANIPRQAKGGVFSQADIPLIKRALEVYKNQLVATEESERAPSAELNQLANLLHRLNNRI
jgi:hypothetical protein